MILIQSSHNPNSRTADLVSKTGDALKQLNIDYVIIDLRDYVIPFCDGRSLAQYSGDIMKLHGKLKEAKHT